MNFAFEALPQAVFNTDWVGHLPEWNPQSHRVASPSQIPPARLGPGAFRTRLRLTANRDQHLEQLDLHCSPHRRSRRGMAIRSTHTRALNPDVS